MASIAARSTARVDMRRRDELGPSIGSELNRPRRCVNEPMVVTAERNTVVSISRPAILPANDVVNICPARRAIASGEGAAAVPKENGDASRSAVGSAAASDVDRHSISVQHHGQDLGGTR